MEVGEKGRSGAGGCYPPPPIEAANCPTGRKPPGAVVLDITYYLLLYNIATPVPKVR